MDTTQVVILILGLGALAGAITAIWALISNIKKSFKSVIVEVLDKKLREHNEYINNKLALQREDSEKRLNVGLLNIENKIDLMSDNYKKDAEKNNAAHELIQDALIESYKQDIRRIYYKLRETGELTDHDKAYVDKIFPLYKAIGGNSDIQAKYTEMCEVYGRRTQEKFDELYKMRKPVRVKKELIEIEKGK